MASFTNRRKNNFRTANWPVVTTIFVIYCCGISLSIAEPIDFARHVRPILSDACFECHGPDAKQREAELRLDTEAGLFRTQDEVTVVVPGDPAASELIRRITSQEEHDRMPPQGAKRQLTPEDVEQLRRWVLAGATWKGHWAFSSLERPKVPAIAPRDRSFIHNATIHHANIHNAIDTFVQARLTREGFKPSPAASRETLIRRVTLDLTGLPPALADLEAFLPDTSPLAYEKVVDRLLASPAFGERMAWGWLDAARYADSNGYQGDSERTMWPWRDWVVRALNDDLPYDQFTIWQLAGDLLPSATFDQQLASGFCRNHMINGEGGRIAEENRVDYVMDMTETMGTVWLGLTLNCCRCHDHKFDPFTQREYYQLFAFFNQTPVEGGGGDPQTPPVLPVPSEQQETQMGDIEQQITALNEQIRRRAAELDPKQAEWEDQQRASANPKLVDMPRPLVAALHTSAERRSQEQTDAVAAAYRHSDEFYRKLQADLDQAEQQRTSIRNDIPKVMVMQDMLKSRKTYILDRGLYNESGEDVTATTPARLPPMPKDVAANRLGLARWLASPENPLTPRVTVNRIWQQLFGTGLVKTTEDFGVQGEVPLQLDLLDWLAFEFRDSGWSVKRLIRLIVTSHTYRQASQSGASQVGASQAGTSRAIDPENRLLARGPRFRMPSWMLRDQALAASGLLVSRQGGPPVNVYQPAGVWEESTFGQKKYSQDHGEALYRRSLYVFWRRIVGPTIFFDNATRQICTVKVHRTNTPLQALFTLNDVTYIEAARSLAEQTLLLGGSSENEQLDYAFRRVLSRRATDHERSILLAGLGRTRTEFTAAKEGAKQLLAVGESKANEQLDAVRFASWTALCLAILNLDETLNKQ